MIIDCCKMTPVKLTLYAQSQHCHSSCTRLRVYGCTGWGSVKVKVSGTGTMSVSVGVTVSESV